MNKHWKVKIFDEVISDSQIGIVRNNKSQSAENTYRYFKMSNIRNNNGINEDSFTFVNASDDEVEKYKLVNNDFLFNTRNSYELVGKTCLYNSKYLKPTLFNNNILRVRFKPELIPQFVAYLFSTLKTLSELDEIKSGTTNVIGIYYKSLKNIQIPIPPLQEQKQIVAILNKAFTATDQAKANIEKNIVNAKELFQSKLNDIFSQKGDGWEEKELSSIGQVQTGTTPPTKDKSNYGPFIPFVKPPHFCKDGSINTGESMLSKKGLEKGRLFSANSVLMVCIGATIGKTGFSEIPVSSNQQINALTPNENYIAKLLYYALISPFVQNQVMSVGKSAQATLPIINKSKWLKLKVYLTADKKKQSKIIKTLDELKENCIKIESNYNKKLKDLDDLKKSILQKAFAGELTEKEVVV